MERIPWRWIPKIKSFKDHLFRWILAKRQVYWDDNFELDAQDLANMYNNWVDQGKATVPEEKLLVFPPKDGWKPLCEFLSPLSDEIKVNCDEILESGELYPHVSEKAQVAFIVRTMGIISAVFEYGHIVVLLLAVLWLATTRSEKKKAKTT